MNILVAKNGSQLGPFSEADIRTKLASGEFAPTDFAWKEGMASWSPLSQMFTDAPAPGASPSATADSAPATYAPQPYNAPQQGQYSAPQTYNSPYPAAYQPGMTPFGAPGVAGGYAGFWLRAGAIVIDIIGLFIINFIVSFLLIAVLGQRTGAGLANLVNLVTNWLYFAYMESSASQATLGKMVVGVKVTDLNGNRIGFGKATGRYFGKIVSGFILAIGFIMAGFTERKQALHDMMAGTLVVKK